MVIVLEISVFGNERGKGGGYCNIFIVFPTRENVLIFGERLRLRKCTEFMIMIVGEPTSACLIR